jgi:hypothetical protein
VSHPLSRYVERRHRGCTKGHGQNTDIRSSVDNGSNLMRLPARWVGNRLGQLSVEQINDCFRASGFSPSDVEAYARVVIRRIALLKALE